jgi:phosphatidylglycerol---prolipoprotein diacylglyceryl transferase
MIDPVIFTFSLFGLTLTLRWYGVLVMLGAVVGTWIAEKEINRRGEKGEIVWDALVWVLPVGIIGARVWYIVNATLGGNSYYVDNPIKMLYIWEGGLHIFGGFLFGAIALLLFLRQQKLDVWLFLDAIAPAVLIGQAIARPANFINQELYGQPTQLPWGIPISAEHRLPQFADLSQYPVATTRFHPTFAYEMALNFIVALFLLWYARQYKERMKPGAVFGAWLVGAGISRSFIEFFRPDQPTFSGSFVTYSMAVSVTMAIVGVLFLLVRYGKLDLAFVENWEEKYKIASPTASEKTVAPTSLPVAEPEKVSRPKAKIARKPAVKAKSKTASATKAKPKPVASRKK